MAVLVVVVIVVEVLMGKRQGQILSLCGMVSMMVMQHDHDRASVSAEGCEGALVVHRARRIVIVVVVQ